MPGGYEDITPFMYVIRVKNGKRNQLKDYLMAHDIESGISYIPCHHFSLFQNEKNNLPITAGSDIHNIHLFGGGIAFRRKLKDIHDYCEAILSDEDYILTNGTTWFNKNGVPLET